MPHGGSFLQRVASIAGCAGVALAATSASAQSIDPTEAGPVFKGWGTSLAWWANVTGQWDDDAQFEALMDDVFDVDEGLGLTIVRLNIGAGQRPDLSFGNYMLPGRLMPAYKNGPDLPYNFEADAAQTRVLLESIERGVQYVEANGNSPPWWMTITQDSSGNPSGTNLAPSNFDDYAAYLADVTQWYRDELGVVFNSVTPLNEPSANWWDGNGNQEGCNIPQSQHPAILAELRAALDARGLQDVPVSGPEEWSTAWTLTGLQNYPQQTLDILSHVATHSYNVDNRAGLAAYASALGKPLWMTEYGTGASTEYGSAMELARRIIGDFREMPNLEAWIIWQVMSTNHFSHTWACMLSNFATKQPGYTFRPQYNSFAQFSRYIRPGSRFLETDDPNTLAAYHPGLQRLVVVALNDSDANRIGNFDISGFDTAETATIIRSSRTDSLTTFPTSTVNGTSVPALLTPESVTTIVIDGVTTAALPTTDFNGDARTSPADLTDFVAALAGNADETDIDLDGQLSYFDIVLMLDRLDDTVVDLDMSTVTFVGLETGDLGDIDLGNGTEGGRYIAEDRMFIQGYARNNENGGTTFQLDGVTLQAGVTYRVTASAADFNQNWTIGGQFVVGISSQQPTITSTPDMGSAVFFAPANNGPGPMLPTNYEFTFTAPATVSNPYLLLRTNQVNVGNQRFGFDRIDIEIAQ